MIITLQVIGLSHSEIPGSKDICSCPGLIAACHVLHRLREPRHPPDALTFFRQCMAARHICIRQAATLILSAVKLRVLSTQFLKLEVFTYSLVCQYVKEPISLRKPDCVGGRTGCACPPPRENVENNGFEPLTPCLQSRCSSQLS